MIFNAVDVQLGVLFISHYMFSPFPDLLHYELLGTQHVSWFCCLNVDNHNLALTKSLTHEREDNTI